MERPICGDGGWQSGLTHGLEAILDAAAEFPARSRIRLVFLGSGSALDGLKTQAQRLALSNVEFLPRISSDDEAARLINAADVMLIHLKAATGGEFSVPHRVLSYMLCGKPIIATAQGSTAALVREHDCGWVCPPSDTKELCNTLLLIASAPDDCRQKGANGLSAARRNYERSHLLEMIEEITRRRIGLATHVIIRVPIPQGPLDCGNGNSNVNWTGKKGE